MDTFASRLALAFKRAGISKRKLEIEADLSKGYVSRLLTPRGEVQRPSQPIIDRLAAALRVDPGWLGRDDPAPSTLDPSTLPALLAEIWTTDETEATPHGRRGTWTEETIAALLRRVNFYGGFGHVTQAMWLEMGDAQRRHELRMDAGLAPKTAPTRERAQLIADARDAEVEAARAWPPKPRTKKGSKK